MGIMNPTVNSSSVNTSIQKANSYRFDYNYPDPWPEDILYNRFDEAIYDITLYSGVVAVATVRAYNYTSWQEYFPGSLQQNYTWNTSAYADTRYDTINLHCYFKRATGQEFEEDYNWTVNKTNCRAPTSVTVASNNVAPSASIKLSWSGAMWGNDVSVSGYEIWRSTSATGTYTKIATVNVDEEALSGNTYVTSMASNGSYYYKVKTISTPSGYDSDLSTAYATLTTKVTKNTAPTTVSIASTNVAPGASVNLSWSGATAGTNTTISGYAIYRATSASGTYTQIATATSSPKAVTSPTSNGSYYYKVVALSSVSGFNSDLSSVYATLTTNFSKPSKPTVSLSSTYVKSGNVTLSYSSTSGTNNAIKGYNVNRGGSLYQTITTTATSGTLSVPCNPTAGASYTYTVIALGNYSNSDTSDGKTVYTYTDPKAPTIISVSNTQPALGASVTLSWENAEAGALNSIQGYKIYRSTSATGTYTQLGSDISSTATSGSTTVTAPANSGTKYYYKIVTKGQRSNSAQSDYISLGANSTPVAPTLCTAGTIYNSRPRLLITVGTDADGDLQKLSATGWQFSRNSDLSGGDKVLARKSTAQSSAGSFSTTVTQTDPVNASASTTKSITYQIKSWTDDPVVAGATTIKAAHITELQDALDDICDYYDLGTTTWIDCIAGETSTLLWGQHILQIELTIRRIADAINAWDPTTSALGITLPALPTSMVPEATVIEQLRAVIALL